MTFQNLKPRPLRAVQALERFGVGLLIEPPALHTGNYEILTGLARVVNARRCPAIRELSKQAAAKYPRVRAKKILHQTYSSSLQYRRYVNCMLSVADATGDRYLIA
jgi:hypothetical protein